MLREEDININYAQWIKKLQEYGCYSEQMIKDLGEQIKRAPFAMDKGSGMAYPGALIKIILKSLCTMAATINTQVFGAKDKQGNPLHPNLFINQHMLIRVLLLQHISKAIMFTPETDDWKKKNGWIYKLKDNETGVYLKKGERTVYLCLKYGIQLSEEEFEAIQCLDECKKFAVSSYAHPLSTLVTFVNQLVTIEGFREQQASQKQAQEGELPL